MKSVFLLVVVENTAGWTQGVVVGFFRKQIPLQFAAINTGVQGNYYYQVWGSTLFSHALLHFWNLLRRNFVKGWTEHFSELGLFPIWQNIGILYMKKQLISLLIIFETKYSHSLKVNSKILTFLIVYIYLEPHQLKH